MQKISLVILPQISLKVQLNLIRVRIVNSTIDAKRQSRCMSVKKSPLPTRAEGMKLTARQMIKKQRTLRLKNCHLVCIIPGMNKLTDRLQLIYDEISYGETVADIGTDHGFLPLALIESEKSPHVIMTDISEGSLKKCRDNCMAFSSQSGKKQAFDLRLGSGLEVLSHSEVDTVVIAGMGGILITELMSKDLFLSHSFKKFILQPRRHVGILRYWLIDNNFKITKESLVRENRFIWPILTVEPGNRAIMYNSDPTDIEYEYPLTLLNFRNELTEEYLRHAHRIEIEHLSAKNSAKNPDFFEIRSQTHRVKRLEYLLALL